MKLSRREFLELSPFIASSLKRIILCDECNDFGLGFIPEPISIAKNPQVKSAVELHDLPSSVDYTALYHQNKHDNGKQGPSKTCVAWAAARYNGVQYSTSINPCISGPRLSPRSIYNMRTLYNCYEDKGMSFNNIKNVLTKYGALEWNEFPWNYDFCEKPPINDKFKIDGFDIYIYSKEQAKSWLYVEKRGHLGFLLGFPWRFDYYNVSDISPVIPLSNSLVDDWHCVVVVGYDDNYEHEYGKGVFKILNSWGNRWGHNGYAFLPYQVWDKEDREAYAFNYEPYEFEEPFIINIPVIYS